MILKQVLWTAQGKTLLQGSRGQAILFRVTSTPRLESHTHSL